MRNQVTDLEQVISFIYAGAARFTLVSTATGARFTYRVKRASGEAEDRPYFVQVLTGADNESDYRYAGCIFPNEPQAIRKGRKGMDKDAPSVAALRWYLAQLDNENADNAAKVEFWHEGACAACGRALTVPESIASGFGPVCAGRV